MVLILLIVLFVIAECKSKNLFHRELPLHLRILRCVLVSAGWRNERRLVNCLLLRGMPDIIYYRASKSPCNFRYSFL